MIRLVLQLIARGADLLPDMEDVLIFGGLAVACYGIAELAGAPAACIAGGGTLLWLGVRRP